MERLKRLLLDSAYDVEKTDYLVKGFSNGFDIGYRGPVNRCDLSENIPICKGIGTKVELWNKVMKEVRLGRYAGPFREKDIPFHHFIQSPIGLVPKDNGKQTRLIFHLSYNFKDSGNMSLNYHTPEDLCRVKYHDLDHAVKNCLELLSKLQDIQGTSAVIYFAKTDVQSAFRLIPLLPEQFCWLLMKAEDPETGETFFFMDKCLPFGASISCAVFQAFSDALAHILEYLVKKKNFLTNYLDDFLFLALQKLYCDRLVSEFLKMCNDIGCPIAEEKTVWGSTKMVFLGILLDGQFRILAIPEEKCIKAINLLKDILHRKTATVKDLERLAGSLNFLCRAIFPGRTYIRRIYDKLVGKTGPLKYYHHVRVDKEMKEDCRMWLEFLNQSGD